MAVSLLLCTLAGILVGLMSGMLGIGGGLLMVPLLIYLLPVMGVPPEVVVPTAIGTSLATIALTTMSGARAHYKRGYIDWQWVRLLTPTLVLGGLFGAWLGARLNPEVVQRIFAVVLLLLALRMFWKTRIKSEVPGFRHWVVRLWGSAMGSLAALVGIGGGALVVPFLSFYHVTMRHAVAVAAVCSLALSLTGALSYGWLGWQVTADTPGLWGFVYAPAWFAIALTSVGFARTGAWAAHYLPVRHLQRVFAVLLMLVAGHLLSG